MIRGLELREVKASHDGRIVLDGLSLEVATGEVHAIIGERRSGKSSIASLLEGNLTLLSGGIFVDVKCVAKPQEMKEAGIQVWRL